MASELSITQQHLLATDVGDITVTAIAQDPDTGEWVRVLRIFGRDPASGETSDVMIELRLTAATRDRLNISVPPSEF